MKIEFVLNKKGLTLTLEGAGIVSVVEPAPGDINKYIKANFETCYFSDLVNIQKCIEKDIKCVVYFNDTIYHGKYLNPSAIDANPIVKLD